MSNYLICFVIFFQAVVFGQTNSMVLVKSGSYIPLYGAKKEVPVDEFLMDVYPVTNQEFLEFVKENPSWKRSQIIKLFADGNYLTNWNNDITLGIDQHANSPVTNISWYAAKEYCKCQGKRLPTLDEWEYAAMANENKPDAREEESYNQYILNWYESPNTYKNKIGETFKNYWGIYDLHGLVWEWTSDFNSVMISGESRKGSSGDTNLFCGGAAIGASDLMNYAAFMRYALRGSIKAKYSIKNLGFRCAKDVSTKISSK